MSDKTYPFGAKAEAALLSGPKLEPVALSCDWCGCCFDVTRTTIKVARGYEPCPVCSELLAERALAGEGE